MTPDEKRKYNALEDEEIAALIKENEREIDEMYAEQMRNLDKVEEK